MKCVTKVQKIRIILLKKYEEKNYEIVVLNFKGKVIIM